MHTHTFGLHYQNAHTHMHILTKQKKAEPCEAQLQCLPPSKPELECLCTTQELELQ